MGLELNVLQHYNPKNDIEIRWDENNETHTSGIGTSYLGGRPYIEGGGSYNVCKSYKITFIYHNPGSIQPQTLRVDTIDNYWSNSAINAQVVQVTGIKPYADGCCSVPYSSPCTDACTAMTMACCLCGGFLCLCCVWSSRDATINNNKIIYQRKLDELAKDKMSREVARLLQEVDTSLSARLKNIQDQQQQLQRQRAANDPLSLPPGTGGGAQVSPEQLRQFAEFQQFQRMQALAVNSAASFPAAVAASSGRPAAPSPSAPSGSVMALSVDASGGVGARAKPVAVAANRA